MQAKNNTRQTLSVNGHDYDYFSLKKAGEQVGELSKLPFSLKVLTENLLRNGEDVSPMAQWLETKSSHHEIAYRPARVLMQDFTGVPAVVDLAAMRSAMDSMGKNPSKINPLSPVDLVIDHSVQVDRFAHDNAYAVNVEVEMRRNQERYEFLHWGQNAFENFRVVPPGTGICHQVNLEYLGKVVWTAEKDGKTLAFPDTLVGTDSHTTMINGLGILGWGVGGIEAEAAMLGQPISMLIPEVIGFKFTGQLREGITATDLVLTVTQMLRKKGVVGKFVEYFGPGLAHLPLADRATISNMSPEYGATCGFFPVDEQTLEYMRLSGRDEDTIALVKAYCQEQGLWRDDNTAEPVFTDTIALDLGTVEASVAGPKRPQDRVALSDLPDTINQVLRLNKKDDEKDKAFACEDFEMHHADVVIAAITSCTNTSNPSVMLAAGLLARNAINKGLTVKPWVKTSLAPGSKVVTDYLAKTGLNKPLDELGFNLVGYGCTTCIGNSGPLPDHIAKTVTENDLVACSVLSGNRNFEGRIHPLVKANWLASPPLVVAYALAGTMNIDLHKDPLGQDKAGKPVYLKDIWPNNNEIAAEVAKVKRDMFSKEYADVFTGNDAWRSMSSGGGETYSWDNKSTYIQHPPFFDNLDQQGGFENINNARILGLFGDSITTDHISPAGAILKDSPAGNYLMAHGVDPINFNSYGSRRGNHEVMMRGTFANIRIRNEMTPDIEGGYTKYIPTGESMPIYGAAMKYIKDNTPLVVIAGKEYGTGSSRDWAAKGTNLLGVKAVIAESFERIHRSNLIGMGVLPLEFKDGTTRLSLGLDGSEMINIHGIDNGLEPGVLLKASIMKSDDSLVDIDLLCRLDTANEVEYYKAGGVLQYVLKNMS